MGRHLRSAFPWNKGRGKMAQPGCKVAWRDFVDVAAGFVEQLPEASFFGRGFDIMVIG